MDRPISGGCPGCRDWARQLTRRDGRSADQPDRAVAYLDWECSIAPCRMTAQVDKLQVRCRSPQSRLTTSCACFSRTPTGHVCGVRVRRSSIRSPSASCSPTTVSRRRWWLRVCCTTCSRTPTSRPQSCTRVSAPTSRVVGGRCVADLTVPFRFVVFTNGGLPPRPVQSAAIAASTAAWNSPVSEVRKSAHPEGTSDRSRAMAVIARSAVTMSQRESPRVRCAMS